MAVWAIVKVSGLEGNRRLDSEYYQPTYTDAVSTVTANGNIRRLGEIARILRGKNPTKYTESGIPVIRAVDLRDLTDLSNVLYASPDKSLFYLAEQDILISSIGAGSIGKVELFTDFSGRATTVSEVSVVRVAKGKFSPAALAMFLASRYGYLQLERRITGSTGQLHLYPKDISTVLVPMLDEESQKQIAKAVTDSISLLKQSKALYFQAEQTLLEELGWDRLDLSQGKWWTVPLVRAQEASRVDAEHFQPKYDKLIAHLMSTERAKPLGEIASYIKRGVQPRYVDGGDVLAVNSRYVGKQLIDTDQSERTDETFWRDNPRAQAKKYDVVMNSTGWGTIGRTNCILHDQRTVVDNHVTIIRTKETICNPIYLAVYLNSRVGLMQTDKWLSGSSGQIELYPAYIAQFLVYLPSLESQQQVADLVQQSYESRHKAKALLEEAKRQVEEMIEAAAG